MEHFTATALGRMLDPHGDALDAEAARRIVGLRIDPAIRARIAELAGRCNEGLLTEEERAESAAYVDGADLIAILKSKARRALAGDPAI